MKSLASFLLLLLSGSLAAHDPLAFASGSWFDPQRNGEGFVVQVLPEERAVVTWFTYPPAGEDGAQAWLIGTGVTVGNRIEIEEMVRPAGAVFGPDFEPGDVVREPWGSLAITFDGCDAAVAAWNGPPAFGSGSMDLVRLSSIDDVPCDPNDTADPDRVVSGRSGAWYDPAHDGEGWMLEMLADGRMVVYWFTYDDQGRQAWLIGEARVEGRTLWIEEMLITGGARFGADFDSADVQLTMWGEFGFLFEDCALGQLRYASTDPRFGEGTLLPVHLAQLAATDCADPPPVKALSGGAWRRVADLDVAASESASAGLDGTVYTAGGYGHLQRLQRYDPAADGYQDLPALPGERHHPMMASDGQHIYVAGGYVGRFSTVTGDNFWRYDSLSDEWEILADLPGARAAGAAVFLHGRVWILGGVGVGLDMQSYDVQTGEWELFPGAIGVPADHMQAVAFENEIWWLGGRDDQTSKEVRIWNPVTRAWRVGPSLQFARAGFAARVVQGQIMVTGGERTELVPFQLVPSMEIFAPGAAGWVPGPPPPIAVHGTTGAAVGGEFILVAGSTVAGTTSSNRATQIYSPAEP
ncbi:MAG: hypothetical protein EHM68_04825 [Lysobacterales bacterium]|nr:MAG: hypothetical protein EHM68_04825 [Xanthomonadales bacterium]